MFSWFSLLLIKPDVFIRKNSVVFPDRPDETSLVKLIQSLVRFL